MFEVRPIEDDYIGLYEGEEKIGWVMYITRDPDDPDDTTTDPYWAAEISLGDGIGAHTDGDPTAVEAIARITPIYDKLVERRAFQNRVLARQKASLDRTILIPAGGQPR